MEVEGPASVLHELHPPHKNRCPILAVILSDRSPQKSGRRESKDLLLSFGVLKGTTSVVPQPPANFRKTKYAAKPRPNLRPNPRPTC
jgi:hypothetical protein